MKKYSAAILILLAPLIFYGESRDTTMQGVAIRYHYKKNIFPKSWRKRPIKASAEKIMPSEIQRSKETIFAAFMKYPQDVLTQNLKVVYYLKSMKFYGVSYGGTNSFDVVYLTDNGEFDRYTNCYMEQAFHHEFSSILFRNYPTLLDTAAWCAANQGSIYSDPENGVGAIRDNQASQLLDSMLCQTGFLTCYAMSSLENDINTIAENLFCPHLDFWSAVDEFPSIRKKTSLLIAFYHQLNPVFTEEYFRMLKSPG